MFACLPELGLDEKRDCHLYRAETKVEGTKDNPDPNPFEEHWGLRIRPNRPAVSVAIGSWTFPSNPY